MKQLSLILRATEASSVYGFSEWCVNDSIFPCLLLNNSILYPFKRLPSASEMTEIFFMLKTEKKYLHKNGVLRKVCFEWFSFIFLKNFFVFTGILWKKR